MTLLLKKLFLMSISMKNGKKPEMQHPASGKMLQRLTVPWPVSSQPLVEGTKGTTLTGQRKERKKDKKPHIRLRLDDKEIIYFQVPERP